MVCLGCGTDEPEDGTSTVASSVGMSSGSTGEPDATTGEPGSTSTGAAESTGSLVVGYAADVQPIWNANCTCHLMGSSGTMTAPFLTLNPDLSHAELVGVAAEQAALSRVEAGDATASYLWLKLTDAHAEVGDGTIMPQGGMLDADTLAIVRAWIDGGALDD